MAQRSRHQDLATSFDLRLIALSAESIRALYAGEPYWSAGQAELAGMVWPVDDLRVLRYRVAALAADPSSEPFLLHAILLDGQLVGRIGCHERPGPDGEVEIGYSVRPEVRGQGVAGRAVDLFVEWLAARGVRAVKASVRPDNEPSLRLLTRRGFVEVGEQWDDEDGRELIFMKRTGV
jgi:[ribosomal protein S5]-alanine N-acetyltransferase